MASWETEITELLQEVQDIAVRFDIDQSLSNEQKNTAKSNVGVTTTVTNVSGDGYKITFNY